VTFAAGSDDDREDAAEPAPGAVVDKVGGVGDQRSVVSVELARLVGVTVVVRVTDH